MAAVAASVEKKTKARERRERREEAAERWGAVLRYGCPRSWIFFFSSRRRHTRSTRDWSSDVCSSDLGEAGAAGLGLAIVRDVVQAHGGRIHLDSAVGKGTRFTLELPRTRSEERRVGKECRWRRWRHR